MTMMVLKAASPEQVRTGIVEYLREQAKGYESGAKIFRTKSGVAGASARALALHLAAADVARAMLEPGDGSVAPVVARKMQAEAPRVDPHIMLILRGVVAMIGKDVVLRAIEEMQE